jgi:hypothetical protein
MSRYWMVKFTEVPLEGEGVEKVLPMVVQTEGEQPSGEDIHKAMVHFFGRAPFGRSRSPRANPLTFEPQGAMLDKIQAAPFVTHGKNKFWDARSI